MRNDVARLLEFVQAAEDIHSEDELTGRVATITSVFGVTSVSVNLIVTPGRVLRPGMVMGRRWSEWSARYAREMFAASDPCLRMLRAQTRPFLWSEALARFGSAQAVRVMAACRETTGALDALVVPVRETDGSTYTAALGGEALDLDPETRAGLHLVGYTYATRGRELLQGIALDARCPLTARQIEVMELVLRGKSDGEIGLILSISSNTAHRHVEVAKAVIGCAKRGQAAHEAWCRGWLN